MAEESNDETESSDDALGKLMGYDKWPDDVAIAFERARGVASVRYIKNKEIDFPAIVAEYRAIETEYLVHFRDNEENAKQVRRIMTGMLLQAAWDKDQPFETCQQYWNDLLQLGFYRIERECNETWLFAKICCEHGQTELGLAVIDPLILELERLRAEPTVTEFAAGYYEDEIGYLQKLRAKLEAQKNGEA